MFGFVSDHEINKVLPVLEKIVAGDFSKRIDDIPDGTKMGDLLHLINDLVDRCDAYVRESAACMHAVSNNQYYRKIIEVSMQGDFLSASRKVNAALGSMQNKTSEFKSVAVDFEDNVATVVRELGSASESLADLVRELFQ